MLPHDPGAGRVGDARPEQALTHDEKGGDQHHDAVPEVRNGLLSVDLPARDQGDGCEDGDEVQPQSLGDEERDRGPQCGEDIEDVEVIREAWRQRAA
ncbi:MAG: hypothetical protein AAGA20_11745 [Planctomycetota bacterium]